MQLKLDPQWKTLVVSPYSPRSLNFEYFLHKQHWSSQKTEIENLIEITNSYNYFDLYCKIPSDIFDQKELPTKKGVYLITENGFVFVSTNLPLSHIFE